MDINPQRVRSAEFKTVKRGLDPDEVAAFLKAVADELERAQNQSTAMEARARAAVARLQELSEGAASQAQDAATAEPVAASPDQSETISRTLLLAQRTADTTIADAKAEAERLRVEAEEEAARTLESTRGMASSLLDEARQEARKVGEEERITLKGEVDALVARRDFLESDVDHMEQFLITQRERLRDAANELLELTDRVPSGLGEVRRPLLSASDATDGESAAAANSTDDDGDGDDTGDDDVDDTGDADGEAAGSHDDRGDAGDASDADDADGDGDDADDGDDGEGDDDGDGGEEAHAAQNDDTPVVGASSRGAGAESDTGSKDATLDIGDDLGDADHVDDLWLPDDDEPVDAVADGTNEPTRGFRLSFGDD